MPLRRTGPGLASVRPGRVVTDRTFRLVAVLDGWWSRVLERADVVSEGGVVSEASGPVYYGTTSVRCVPEPAPEPLRRFDLATLARLLLADPHARTRLLRLAHREATTRAGGPLDVLYAELHARPLAAASNDPATPPSIDVEIEVSAPIVDLARPIAVD